MYWQHMVRRGRPPERRRNLHDLLRLTLAAVEVASTRREVLDAVGGSAKRLPSNLLRFRHAVYETSVVYEFSQLARQDFEAHGNVPLWERPISWFPPGAAYWRSAHIDMALFSTTRDVETRIEFGKAIHRPQVKRDPKLESDAAKLHELRGEHRGSKHDPSNSGKKSVENFVVIWEERDSRTPGATDAKLTAGTGKAWLERCVEHAANASTTTCNVVVEAAAASTLVTFEPRVHRSAFAVIYSVDLVPQSASPAPPVAPSGSPPGSAPPGLTVPGPFTPPATP